MIDRSFATSPRASRCAPVSGPDYAYRGSEIATTRLVAQNAQREEPITYWIRIGDPLVRNARETRGTIFAAWLNRKVLDGILVRGLQPRRARIRSGQGVCRAGAVPYRSNRCPRAARLGHPRDAAGQHGCFGPLRDETVVV